MQSGKDDQPVVAVAFAERRGIKGRQLRTARIEPGDSRGDGRFAVVGQLAVVIVQPGAGRVQRPPNKRGVDGLRGEFVVGRIASFGGAKRSQAIPTELVRAGRASIS